MRLALRLARRGYGATSPNPMVGAVLVKRGSIIGRGWHRRAGGPHAEIEALREAEQHGQSSRGATLYVTLEPCCTHGRTPPCTESIIAASIKRVVVGVRDPNPKHAGRGLTILGRAGIEVILLDAAPAVPSPLILECRRLNEAFNHWIVQHTPFVTVKAAMTLDGKIATPGGESKWITGERARAFGMKLRQGSDAVLVGVNTVLADDPSLTFRGVQTSRSKLHSHRLRRIVLDSMARTPPGAKVASDEQAPLTTIVVSRLAPKQRIARLSRRVNVIVAPLRQPERSREAGDSARHRIDLRWLLRKLGSEDVTSLLVEGGGEVNASFLMEGLAQRVAFFYAPKVLGGRDALKAVAGKGAGSLNEIVRLHEPEWRGLGEDLLLTALVGARQNR